MTAEEKQTVKIFFIILTSIWGMAQLVECVPDGLSTLSLSPSTVETRYSDTCLQSSY